jgi:hypothetical protein
MRENRVALSVGTGQNRSIAAGWIDGDMFPPMRTVSSDRAASPVVSAEKTRDRVDAELQPDDPDAITSHYILGIWNRPDKTAPR